MQYDFSPLRPHIHKMDFVAWDLDGTLVRNNEAVALDLIRDTINEYVGVQTQFKNAGIDCCRHLAGKHLPDILQIVSDVVKFDIPASIVVPAILARRAMTPEANEFVDATEPFKQFANFVKEQQIPQMIVTSSERSRAEKYAVRAGYDQIFGTDNGKDYLLSCVSDFGDKPRPKPMPDGHERARLQHGVTDPRRVISFEDSMSGLKAGIADGTQTIGHLLATHIPEAKKDGLVVDMKAAGAVTVMRQDADIIPAVLTALERMPPRMPGLRLQAG